MSEFSQISRLQEENRKALLERQQQLHTCERFKQDYEKLEELLQTLPNKTTHEVMVPFGSVAFMPGKLIHTNEIMVLLGDNWFAERSASQALEIVARRKKYLENNIAGINEDLKGFESRIKFASEIESAAEENSDVKEIKEELSPQEEQRLLNRRSRRAHPKAAVLGGSKKVLGFKSNFRDTSSNNEKEARHMSFEESSLFARLDELEEKEAKNDELDQLWQDDSDNIESKAETGFKKRENDTRLALDQSESTDPDVKEIKEELSPQEEQRLLNRGSRKAHSKAAILGGSKRVAGFKSNLKDGLENKEKEAQHVSSEEISLFARLDELKEKEAKNAKLDQLSQDDSDYEQSKAESGFKKTEDNARLALARSESTNQTKKKVTWESLDNKSDTVVNWNDSSESEGDDDDNDVPRTISVRFSSTGSTSLQREPEKQLSQQPTAITTPADIYSQFTPKQELKSILRKTSVEEKVNKISLEERTPTTQQLPTNISKESKEKEDFNPQKAFTGTIVEKPAIQKSEQTTSQMSTCQPEKKLSKFKAARQKQQ